MEQFKQYNPDIYGEIITGERSSIKQINSKIFASMNELGVSQVTDYNIVSTNVDNLLYGLIPSYSPIHNNGQIYLSTNDMNSDFNPEALIKISEYLNVYFGDNNVGDYNITPTLLSQFSGLMIKDILNGNSKLNEYILGKLFRKSGSGKIKEYFQLETRLINTNLKEVITFLENFLFRTMGHEYSLVNIKEKSFPFVLPGFEFEFMGGEQHTIKIVGGFVDEKLINKFNINNNYFIFGANLNKFLNNKTTEKREKKNTNQGWKVIDLNNCPVNKFEYTSDIKNTGINKVTLQPNKIDLLNKERLNLLIGDLGSASKEQISINILGDNLEIKGNWVNVLHENIVDYLIHYYSGKIITNTKDSLVVKFQKVKVSFVCEKIFGSNEVNNVHFNNGDLKDFFGYIPNIIDLEKIFNKFGYQLSSKQEDYILKNNFNKKKLREILGEIIYYFPIDHSKNNLSINAEYNHSKNSGKIINIIIPNFFINNNFNELDIATLSNINNGESGFDNIFGSEIKLIGSNIKISNSLNNGLINYLVSNRLKIVNKGFSLEKLDNKFNLIFYINGKDSGDYFNQTYNYLITLFDLIGLGKPKLTIDNSLNKLKNGQSFQILDSNENIIGYLGVMEDNNKVKGNIYICEIKINL